MNLSTIAKPITRGSRATTGFLGNYVHGLAMANIAAQIGIIVTGGLVRLTESGLGCSDWPHCEPGSFTPEYHAAAGIHGFIEFGNRLLTFVLAIIALLLAIAIWRARPQFKWLGLVPGLGIIAQAVLGGIVVLLHLNPLLVGLHMFISAGLVWISVQIGLKVRDAPRRNGRPISGILSASRVLLMIVVVLGVLTTGAGPHSGDANATERLALDPAIIAQIHGYAVVLYLAAIVWMVARVRDDRSIGERDEVRKAWLVLVTMTLAQGFVGVTQYFTGLPELLVGVHMLGIGLLVAAQSAANYLLKGTPSSATSVP
ncbi:COX15/CtaA family protein [Demequina oxidasica]|uniref:COX15/CtaA family protein n=1 Tax=Demequina oxidasica TaxID=676199 RepID=UPI000782D52E|nr:COX15/CtaA family protein [Demequina oxidasica]